MKFLSYMRLQKLKDLILPSEWPADAGKNEEAFAELIQYSMSLVTRCSWWWLKSLDNCMQSLIIITITIHLYWLITMPAISNLQERVITRTQIILIRASPILSFSVYWIDIAPQIFIVIKAETATTASQWWFVDGNVVERFTGRWGDCCVSMSVVTDWLSVWLVWTVLVCWQDLPVLRLS